MVRQMDGAFAGLLHVTVHKISTAAFMDFTDSYVSLQLGSDEQKTSCKNNVSPPLFAPPKYLVEIFKYLKLDIFVPAI